MNMETSNKIDTFRQISQLMQAWSKTKDELHRLQPPPRPMRPAIISTPADWADYTYRETRFREQQELSVEQRNALINELKDTENSILQIIPDFMLGIPIEIKAGTRTFRIRKKADGYSRILIISDIEQAREVATADLSQ
jgi:hypothetical protein